MTLMIPMTYEEALIRSQEEAIRRGCHGVTQYWWTVVPDGLLIHEDDDLEGLTEDEISAITDYVVDISEI